MATRKGIDVLRGLWKLNSETKTWNRLLGQTKLIDGGDGTCSVELKVDEQYENMGGTLHGGVTATLIDMVSTAALMTTGHGHPGVSVDLNITYLRAVPVGDTAIVNAKVDKCGRNIAFTSVELRRKSDNTLAAIGRHTKAFPGAK